MIDAEILGSVAAVLTTSCFIPQAVKVLKSPDTKAISLLMYIMFSIGVSLWLVYGLMIDKYPIIFANIFTLILTFIILYKKVRNVLDKID